MEWWCGLFSCSMFEDAGRPPMRARRGCGVFAATAAITPLKCKKNGVHWVLRGKVSPIC